MPLTLSSTAITEKNKLSTTSKMLLCLKITVPGVVDPIRVVRDNQNLTWQGETWVAFPFELESLGGGVKGEVPQVVLRVSNVSRAMETYLHQYDTYCKTNGWSAIEVNIYVVNTAAVALNGSCDPEVEHVFELKQPKADSKWATFTLGASNPFNMRFPRSRIMKNQCRYKDGFKGTRCGYSGAETSCNKTLARCRELGNSERFGGFPGVGYGGVKIFY